MSKEYVKLFVDRLGYQVQKKSTLFCDIEKEASGSINIIRPYTMLSQERLLTLFN